MKMIKKISTLLVMLLAFSCSPKEQGWTLNGVIDGMTDNGVLIVAKQIGDVVGEEFPIKEGKFSISGEALKEPRKVYLGVKDRASAGVLVYLENGVTTVKASMKVSGRDKSVYFIDLVSVEGSIVNKHHKEIWDYSMSFYLKDNDYSFEEKETKILDYKLDFIKKNPSAYHSAELVEEMARGVDKKRQEELLSMLTPGLDFEPIRRMKAKTAKDVAISNIIDASNVAYKVDSKFDGSAFKDAKYLGVLSNGNIVSLNKDKTIAFIDGNGKRLSSFTASADEIPSTMAIDEKDNIYVLVPVMKEMEQMYRGKKVIKSGVASYNCDIYSVDGKKINTIKLEGISHATGARASEGKIMIADMSGSGIDIFNASTGAREAEIKDMRPCCGILDFDINDNNELLVANLGAFRVQKYDLTGKQLLAFGSRGNDVSNFHGCCNPVSVAYLSNGAIVTVEKDPTRVKVFSKEGAKVIAGIEEMVKGCSYIPMAVDAKDNLYLASPTKGIVRCVAITKNKDRIAY